MNAGPDDLSPSDTFLVEPQVTWRDGGGELALFDARTQDYHVLNETAAAVWRLLAEGATLAATSARLAATFAAPGQALGDDVTGLAREFISLRLVTRHPRGDNRPNNEIAATPELSAETLLSRSASAVSAEVDGEALVFDIDTGDIHHLNDPGSRIWSLLSDPRTMAELCRCLEREFDIEPEPCWADVTAFVIEMRGRGMISFA